MDSPRPAAAARSEYVQARLDAILSRAEPVAPVGPVPQVGSVELGELAESGTVLTARHRLPVPVRAESVGRPRRTHAPLGERSEAVRAALAEAAGPTAELPGTSPGPLTDGAVGRPGTEAVLVEAAGAEDAAGRGHGDGSAPWDDGADPDGSGAWKRSGGPADGSHGLSLDTDERSVTIRLPRLTRRHLGVLAAVLALAVAFSAFLLLRARADSQPVPLPSAVQSTGPTTSSGVPVDPTPAAAPPGGGAASGDEPSGAPSPTPEAEIWVHVLGEVTDPGVVRLAAGSRVVDAVEEAGGLTPAAEPGELNLAQVLADGQQVHVAAEPTDSQVRDARSGAPGAAPRGEGGADGGGGSGSGGADGGDGGSAEPLDLNAASAVQLEGLPGVGPVTAGKIVTWREEHGGFTRVEELQEVSGIGPKTYAEIAPHVRV